MNKRQFIDQLRFHLSVLNTEERNEIISFYEDRFNNAIYEGKTEQDVVSSLESPEEIAKNVLMEYGIEKRVREQRVEPASIIGILFFDLFIASWLIPVLVTVSGAIAVSWFSYFTIFSAFGTLGFFKGLAAVLLGTAVFAAYLVFIIYFVSGAIKVILGIASWHVKVFTGRRDNQFAYRLDSFNPFDYLKKINITHKLLLIIFLIGMVASISGASLWRTVAKNREVDNAPTETTMEVYEFDVDDLEDFTLTTSLVNTSIDIEHGSSDKIVVRHQNSNDYEIEYTSLGDSLTIIDETNAMNFSMWENTSLFSLLLEDGWDSVKDHMTIEIPAGMEFSELDLHTSNGTIDVDGMDSTNLEVTTTNGSIDLVDVTATTLRARNTNGEISVNDSFAVEAHVSSTNGQLDLNDFNTPDNPGQKVRLSLTNGEINAEDTYFLDIYADTTNGNIDYYVSDDDFIADRAEFDTTNGKVEHNVRH